MESMEMTLPTIKLGQAEDGRFWAKFTPNGWETSIKLWGDTQQEATEAAFDWLNVERQQTARQEHPAGKGFVHIPESDPVSSPSHYTRFDGVEVIEITRHLSFTRGSAVKYICRAGYKDPARETEDILKATMMLCEDITLTLDYDQPGALDAIGDLYGAIQTLSNIVRRGDTKP